MIRIFKRLPGVIFMVLLLGLAGKEALSHQRTYSPVEKRELQTRPEISITKVLDGRFQKKYESYLRDQFPGRDHWVSFQTDMELFMGKNEIHNVYIGKNHYLLEHYTEKEFDPQQISKNLQALEKFVGKTKQNADVHVMMVPTKSWVLREKLPAFAPHYKEQKFYDALQQKLEKEDVPVFLPLVRALGISTLHFGILFVVGIAIGMITPPVAINLFVASGITGLSLEKISKAVAQ